MLRSNASDFANNDRRTLTLDFVNPTGPDSIGNYYIKGEVVNNGNASIQNLKITAHWYDSMHKLIGVTFGYPDNVPQSLDSGKRTTFTILGDGHSDLIGNPKFVELSAMIGNEDGSVQLVERTKVINECDYDLKSWKSVDTSHFLLYRRSKCDWEQTI